MAAGKFVTFTSRDLIRAEQRLDEWSSRGLSEAVKQGMDEYGFKLGDATYSLMKLPSTGPRTATYVGLSWKRTKQFHSPPRATSRAAEWEIRVKPSYLALWQEHGVRPHDVFNPDKQRANAFRRATKRQTRIRLRQRAVENISPNLRTRAERSKLSREKYNERKVQTEIDALKAARGNTAVMGYSDPSWIPKKNNKTDWFDPSERQPKATTGARAGQIRPVRVRSGSKISTKRSVPATLPIKRGAIRISGRHRERMAQLMSDAYSRR
jgi:hypothetical protein